MCYNDNEPMTSIYFERVEYVIYVDEFAISTVINEYGAENHTCSSMTDVRGTYL